MAQKHNVSCIEQPMTVATTEQGPQKRYRRLRFPSFDSVVWSEKNPLLQKGELGHEKDTGRFKVGDGVTYWEDLPYNSVGDKGDKGDNATINGYNTINIVEGTNITVEQEGDTLIISATGAASGSYNKEEIDNKFAVVNASIDANADAIQKTRNDYEVADQEIRADMNEKDAELEHMITEHAEELTTLRGNQASLGDQVSNIESKIPQSASDTNPLITKQQLLDEEMDIRDDYNELVSELQTQITAQASAIATVDSSAVHKTGDETVAGTKTFTAPYLLVKNAATSGGTGISIFDSNGKGSSDLVHFYTNGTYYTRLVNHNITASKYAYVEVTITDAGVARFDGNGLNYMTAPTPASTSNGTDVATTAWANAKFLPLAGGTLSGVITRSGTQLAKRNVDNSYLELDGGTTYLNGAFLRLDGKDSSGKQGIFTLATGDGSKNIALVGKTDGTLTWNGQNVITPAGMVSAFAGTSVPSGWLKCDGSAVSRTTYAKLFTAIGTRYGTGDGSTTFNLPAQSVLPLGLNANVSVLGTGKTLGLTNGTNNVGMGTYSTEIYFYDNAYNTNITNSFTGSTSRNGAFGVTTDSSKSGLKGTVNLANATGAKAIVCIKY